MGEMREKKLLRLPYLPHLLRLATTWYIYFFSHFQTPVTLASGSPEAVQLDPVKSVGESVEVTAFWASGALG